MTADVSRCVSHAAEMGRHLLVGFLNRGTCLGTRRICTKSRAAPALERCMAAPALQKDMTAPALQKDMTAPALGKSMAATLMICVLRVDLEHRRKLLPKDLVRSAGPLMLEPDSNHSALVWMFHELSEARSRAFH